jgi:hypothetical protein
LHLERTNVDRRERIIHRHKEQLALYFQHVTIWWTKASRGMPQAGVRAQLPHAVSLSPAELNALDPRGGVHTVTMREEEGFTRRVEMRPLPDKEPIMVGAVTVTPNEVGMRLRYRYTQMIGAPDRSHRPPVEFDVAIGERARVTYNGRFSGYSIKWLYKLSVITAAVGIAPSADLFTGALDHRVEDLAELF